MRSRLKLGAGWDTLREACAEMGVRLIACEAGLRAEALDPSLLLANAEVAGIARFCEWD